MASPHPFGLAVPTMSGWREPCLFMLTLFRDQGEQGDLRREARRSGLRWKRSPLTGDKVLALVVVMAAPAGIYEGWQA